MNPEITITLIYEVLSPYTGYISAFFVGFCLLAAAAVLVVKAVSFKP